jgi:hypothetical protein
MDKITAKAYEKMQKREHLLRVITDKRGLRRITQAEHRAESKIIMERYALTDEEQAAYDRHNAITDQRRSK